MRDEVSWPSGCGTSSRQSTSALTTNVRALCGAAWLSPSSLLLASDAGTVATFGVKDSRVASMRVAPSQVAADRSGERRVIGMVAVGDDELTQRPEVSFDRVRP